jgi:hypothetical protein
MHDKNTTQQNNTQQIKKSLIGKTKNKKLAGPHGPDFLLVEPWIGYRLRPFLIFEHRSFDKRIT